MCSRLLVKYSKSTFVALLLWTTLLKNARCYDNLLTVQCQAICLEEFYLSASNNITTRTGEDQRDALISFTHKGNKYLDDCQQDLTCSQCIKPCSQTHLTLKDCPVLCQPSQLSCMKSCARLHDTRPGSCPSNISAAASPQHACGSSCVTDADCQSNHKCCPQGSGCSQACRRTVGVTTDVVGKPMSLRYKERRQGYSLFLTWQPPTDQSRIVIYVVESRSTFDPKPTWTLKSDWSTIAKTSRHNAIKRHIKAGHWYQFRVASVGSNGTRGFSSPTSPYKSSREVQPPNAPGDFAEDGFTVHDGKIDVTLVWSKPASDLPLIKYLVYWSRRLDRITPTLISLRVHTKHIKPDEMSCVLENLLPDTAYHVEVEAVAKLRDVRLKSRRSYMLIRTYAIPGVRKVPDTPLVDASALDKHKLVSLHKLSVGDPYYYGGVVHTMVRLNVLPGDRRDVDKYMLRWLPSHDCHQSSQNGPDAEPKVMAATTHRRKFILYDLLYGCTYTLKAQVVNSDGRPGPVYQTTFAVPTCSNIAVKGRVRPKCHFYAPLPKVKNIAYSIYITGPNITAVIRWRGPVSTDAITGYTVKWGRRRYAGRTYRSKWRNRTPNNIAQIDDESVTTTTVPKAAERLALHELTAASDYVVTVQAVSHQHTGPLSRIQFSTPDVSHSLPRPDINKFIEEGSKYKEQALQSRSHLYGRSSLAVTDLSPHIGSPRSRTTRVMMTQPSTSNHLTSSMSFMIIIPCFMLCYLNVFNPPST